MREITFINFHDIQKEMKWGVPAYSGGKSYIVALKDHVNIGFSLKALSKQEKQLLKGSVKTMRHMETYFIDEIDEKKIVDLLM